MCLRLTVAARTYTTRSLRTQSYNIRDLDWAFVSTLDAGSWFAPEFAGERVPLLREGLDFARAVGILAYLDVKSTATGPEGLGAIASILEEYQDISQRIIVGVWSELALANANAVRLQQLSQLSFIGSLPPAQAAFEGFIALNRELSFCTSHPLLIYCITLLSFLRSDGAKSRTFSPAGIA